MIPPSPRLYSKRQRRSVDLTGQQFDRLLVLGSLGSVKGRHVWACQCACGNFSALETGDLQRKIKPSRSCGCLARDKASTLAQRTLLKHGHARANVPWSPEFTAWQGMKRRCLDNPRSKDWPNYAGRGIRICDEWLHDFPQFLIDVGLKPSPELSLDRINNNGNYEPGNVRWATQSQQAFNRRPK